MMLAAGCSKDQTVDPTITPTAKQASIKGSAEQQEDPEAAKAAQDTRTILKDNKVLWSQGDVIQLILKSDVTKQKPYTLTEGSGTPDGTFTGDELGTGSKYAFYPQSAFKSISGSVISFELPATQQYIAGSFGNGANPMIAETTVSGALKFINLCGALKLQVVGSGTVDKIVLMTAGEKITGTGTVNMTYTGRPALTLTTANATSTTLENINEALNATTPKQFYVTLPAGTYAAGLKVQVVTTDGQEMVVTTTNPITIKQASVLPLSKMTFTARHFPDPAFRKALVNSYGLVQTADGKDIDINNAANKEKFVSMPEFYINTLPLPKDKIFSVKGLEYFTGLKRLKIYNQSVSSFDLSKFPDLEEFAPLNCPVKSVDLSKNPKLTSLTLTGTLVSTVDLSNNTALTNLSVSNILSSIDLSHLSALNEFYCNNSSVTSLDLSKCPRLTKLYCYNSALTSLDISNNPKLTTAVIGAQKNNVTIPVKMSKEQLAQWNASWGSDANNVRVSIESYYFPDEAFRNKLVASYGMVKTADGKDIDINNATNKDVLAKTAGLAIYGSINTHGAIKSLQGIEYFTELTSLLCYWHSIDVLNLSKNTKLVALDCGSNYLTSLVLPESSSLTTLKTADNKLTSLDLSKYTELITLHCYQNALKTLDISGLPKLNITLLAAGSQNNNQTLTLKMTDAQKTTWATLSVSSSNANVAGGYFPDANFRTYLATQGLVMTDDGTDIDVNNTTNRTKFKEIETITTNGDTGITSFKGVEFFTELTKFSYYKTSGKPTISSIDLTKNTKLTYIGCSSDISQIDLSKNPLLQELYLNDCSNLTSLNLSNCKAITTFQCRRSQLKTLDLSMLTVTDVSNFLVGSQRNAAGNALMVIAVRLSPAQAVKGISNSSFVDNIAICTAATGAKFIPDDAFRSYMVNTLKLVEKNGDIDFENDANQTIFRNTTEINSGSSAINSVKGIECFYNLTWLGIPSCNLTSVDVSKNTGLTTLWCSANKLTALNLSKNTKLSRLLCDRNQITALDLSKNTALLQVSAYQNCMSTLDLSMMKNVMTKNGSTTGIAVGGQVASVLGTPIQITLYVTQNQHTEGINTANNTNVTLQVK